MVGEKVKLKSLEGEPPSLIDKQLGCAFAPRCPNKNETCNPTVDMELIEISPDYFVDACNASNS